MKKVLLLGAGGLLGRYLLRELNQKQLDIYGQSRQSDFFINSQFNPADHLELVSNLNTIRPEIIINTISITNVDECEKSKEQAQNINVEIVRNIVNWLESNAYCRFIQFSTDHFYNLNHPQKEGECEILNHYAQTKFDAEQIALGYKNTLVLRTNFFGKSLKPGRESFTDWLWNSYNSKSQIKLADDVIFNPLSLNSLANISMEMACGGETGIFNIGSKNWMSKYHFGKSFFEYLGVDSYQVGRCKLEDLGLLVTRPKNMVMDVGKLLTIMGEMPSLDSEIRLVVKEYL